MSRSPPESTHRPAHYHQTYCINYIVVRYREFPVGTLLARDNRSGATDDPFFAGCAAHSDPSVVAQNVNFGVHS